MSGQGPADRTGSNASSDELLAQLRVLNGFDTDLVEDQTRVTNRLRDALTSIAPALERALGSRLQHAGIRDLVAAFPTLTALRAAGPDGAVRSFQRKNNAGGMELLGG